jgi:hypothetical protein
LLLTIYFNQAQIPGYYLFAFQGRAQAKAILESRTVDQITELNDATRNLVASLQAQIVSLDNSFASYRRASEEKLIALEQSNQLVVQQLQLLPGQIGLALAGAGHANPPPPPPVPVAATTRVARPSTSRTLQTPCYAILECEGLYGPAIYFDRSDCDALLKQIPETLVVPFDRVSDALEYIEASLKAAGTPPTAPPTAAPPTAAPPTAAPPTAPAAAPRVARAAAPHGNPAIDARALLLRTNAPAFLGGSHIQPVVDKAALPSSWTAILTEWRLQRYETFRHLNMKEWSNKDQKTRYIKRKSAMEEIERFGSRHEISLEEAARLLDREKTVNGKTMNQHLAIQRRSNPGVATRAQSEGGRRRRGPPVQRRRNQAAKIVAERQRGAPPAAAAAVVYPPSNNSQGERIRVNIVRKQNELLLRRAAADRLRMLPAVADVLLPGAAERVRDFNLGGG